MSVTPRHGKGANIAFDSTGGSLVLLSSGIDDMSLSRELEPAEVTNFGDNDKAYIPGLRGATLSFSGQFSSTHAEVLDGVLGRNSTASMSWEFSPDGSTASGRHLLKGEGFLTSVEYTASIDDKVGLSCEVIVTGAVTSTNH